MAKFSESEDIPSLAPLLGVQGFGNPAEIDVPVEHLDYGYVRECSDLNELNAILAKLKSGVLGSYPDLERFTEKRMKDVMPADTRMRYESVVSSVSESEKKEVASDLDKWVAEIAAVDSSLNKRDLFGGSSSRLPPVRGQKAEVKVVDRVGGKEEAKKAPMTEYYKKWDKLDRSVGESDDVEDEEETKVESGDMGAEWRRLGLSQNPVELPHPVRLRESERERAKGNESFRANDWENAEYHYSRCLCLDEENLAARSNRALVRLKRKLFQGAESDADAVLQVEPNHLKCLYRRADARRARGKYIEALSDIDHLLDLEPQNTKAKDLKINIQKQAKQSGIPLPQDTTKTPSTRVPIIMDSDDESSEDEEEGISSGGGGAKPPQSISSGAGGAKPPQSISSGGGGAKPPQSISSPPETYTRVPISMDSDDSEEEEEENFVEQSHKIEEENFVEQSHKIEEEEEEEEEEEYDESTMDALAVALKDAGNRLFQSGDLNGALDKWIEALDREHRLLSVRSNIAFAQIRLGQYETAVQTCLEALDLSKSFTGRGAHSLTPGSKLHSVVCKLNHRLGVAYRGLGDLHRAQEVLEEALRLMQGGPGKEATEKVLLEVTRARRQIEKSDHMAKHPKKSMLSEKSKEETFSGDSSSSSSSSSSSPSSKKPILSGDSSSSSASIPAPKMASPPPTPVAIDETAARAIASVHKDDVPPCPKTSVELERVLRSIRDQGHAAAYLGQISPSQWDRLFKKRVIEASLLGPIVQALHTFASSNTRNADQAVQALSRVAKARGFPMALMMLSPTQKRALQDIASKASEKETAAFRKTFKI